MWCATAGVLEPIGPVGSVAPADFLRTIEVNLYGTYLSVHFCLPALREAGGGVVTLSGGGATGRCPLRRLRRVQSRHRGLAERLRDGVPINAIAPGFVATRMQEAMRAAGPERAGKD